MYTTINTLPPHVAHRYALYLAPTGPWLKLGRRWLGRCADTGAALTSIAPADWVQEPRRYGLHATLKAPFRLAASVHPGDLDKAARRIALRHRPFELPLVLAEWRGFLVWRVATDAPAALAAIAALARDALCQAEPLRAPLSDAERARRLATPLSASERAMLDAWGYPYALETYVFHITLTDVLAAPVLEEARVQLAALQGKAKTMTVNALSVFVQPQPGADFVVARHYGFDGSTTDGVGAAWLRPLLTPASPGCAPISCQSPPPPR